MGRKSRIKRDFRRKYPGGWTQYMSEERPSKWSFADGFAGFDVPEGTGLVGTVLLSLAGFVVSAALGVFLFVFGRRPGSPRLS